MDKVWLKHYEKGIADDIDMQDQSTLVDMIDHSLSQFAKLPSYSCMGKTLTYAEIDQMSNNFAAYLQNTLKLKKGAKVAIMMPNILQYPIVLFGVLRAGMVVVNVNPLYTARELEHQLKDSEAEAIVLVDNFAHVLEQAIAKTKVKSVVLTKLCDFIGFPKSLIGNFLVKYVKKMVPNYSLPGSVDLRQALAMGEQTKLKKPQLTCEDIAFLQYTGGTTGVSKGAMLTHRNLIANTSQALSWISNHVEVGKEIIITALPLYHIFSLTANCLTFLKIGAHNILITNPRDLDAFIKDLKSYKFTAITGVNTLFNGLANHPKFSEVDVSALNLALGGGMAVQKAVADKWRSLTNVAISQAYGLTETSPAATMNPLSIKEFNGTIGLPLPSTIIKILDDEEKELPYGEAGELCIQGPQVMKGYWKNEAETAKSFTKDGFLKTGDVATMSEQGFVTIVDRKKDMIIVSGFNVYPNEIEDVVVSHDAILEAAAVGVQHEKSGEAVKVYAVKKDQSITEDELISFCRKHLTGYKVPKHVVFRKELPKSNVGKILRKPLRDLG